ncbi:MAG: DM13 domain-containing protein [Leptolyngbya sp. SIO4C1]|nr:DM13 domain-containing protein [Leptolyngbya sp. SIO4C1]
MKTFLFTSLSALMLTGSVVSFAQAKGIAEPVAPLAASSTETLVAQAAARPLSQGQFVTVDRSHATTGGARIVEENGQRYLEFDAAFDTARGPTVQVVFYNGATVPVNLAEADYTVVADLQRFSGAQRYRLPSSLNLDSYQSVAIWCADFNITFGYASLG